MKTNFSPSPIEAHVAKLRAKNIELRVKFPFMVEVKDYVLMVGRGEIPKPHEIDGASWVDYPGNRTFGFETENLAMEFVVKWRLEE